MESTEIQLASGRTITLNDQQAEALRVMKLWVNDRTDKFFTLSGYAGTGKTTITKELIRYYNEINPYSDIAVSAPTHKARKVIQRATGRCSYTIQKLLGLRPNTDLDDFDINKPQFDEKARKLIKDYRLLIIDEASMLNSDLFDLIVKEASGCRIKILFMGDSAQLPPVNESISKIFTSIGKGVQLTKVERQAGSNPLMSIYDSIRSDLKAKHDVFSHESATNEAGEGITFHLDRKVFQNEVFELFASQDYQIDPDFVKMLTYTNESVSAWNNAIRNHLYGNPSKPILIGDILFAYNTCAIDQDQPLIENSSDYVVESVEEDCTEWAIDVYKVLIRSVDEGLYSFVNIVRDSGMENFLGCFHVQHRQALSASGNYRKFAWKKYFEFKNSHLLLSDIRDNGKLIVKKDTDYGYAITVRKSQGSTFTNVAISETNLDTNLNDEERNKLKYVAFSRPIQRAIIYTNKK